MPAFTDDDMNILHISTSVLHASIENGACVAHISNQFLLQTLRDLAHVLMVRIFHVSQLWWWRSKCPWAFGFRISSLITVCLVLILQHQFPAHLRRILLSTSLEHIRFLNLSRVARVAWLLLRLLFFHRHSSDGPEIPNFVKRFLTPLLARHQTWLRCRRRIAFHRSWWCERNYRKTIHWNKVVPLITRHWRTLRMSTLHSCSW